MEIPASVEWRLLANGHICQSATFSALVAVMVVTGNVTGKASITFWNPFSCGVATMVLTFLAIGLAAGVLAGLFGIGGGVLIVPALVYFASLPLKTATGTSLGALLLPVGFLGAWFGARLALASPPALLQRLFAMFLVAVAIRMFIKA